MKRILFGILTVLMIACLSGKKSVKITSSEKNQTSTDSTEYELITFDAKFETWYLLNGTPVLARTKEYYEMWNRQYVTAWNMHTMNDSRGLFFEPIVGYEPTVDYGFELNHKLFYYFMYVENVLKVPVLQGGGPKTVFSYTK
jgi:hypothetical protein